MLWYSDPRHKCVDCANLTPWELCKTQVHREYDLDWLESPQQHWFSVWTDVSIMHWILADPHAIYQHNNHCSEHGMDPLRIHCDNPTCGSTHMQNQRELARYIPTSNKMCLFCIENVSESLQDLFVETLNKLPLQKELQTMLSRTSQEILQCASCEGTSAKPWRNLKLIYRHLHFTQTIMLSACYTSTVVSWDADVSARGQSLYGCPCLR